MATFQPLPSSGGLLFQSDKDLFKAVFAEVNDSFMADDKDSSKEENDSFIDSSKDLVTENTRPWLKL